MSKLSGKPFNAVLEFWGGQDPDMPVLSAAEKKQITDMFERITPVMKPRGIIMVFGTSGDLDTGDMRNLFFEPKNYKFTDNGTP